ncbi:MAG: helix-turn-helix transcriptional regulator [Dehalococcoidales bacterium]|nr:helix-turn-helix transcriptional regulator [Dehalococcoidales bacterium]
MAEKQLIIDPLKLRRFREARQLTQGQLAHKAGITQSHISQMESGKRPNATLATVGKLAAALGVSIDDLLIHPRPYREEELPDFHMYVSRKFRNNPRLQRALVAAYEALTEAREEEEEIRKREKG